MDKIKFLKEKIFKKRYRLFLKEDENIEKYLNLIDKEKIKDEKDLEFVIKGALKSKDGEKATEDDFTTVAKWIANNYLKGG